MSVTFSLKLLWIAYSLVWALIGGYMLYLGRKQKKVLKEIQFLKDLEQ